MGRVWRCEGVRSDVHGYVNAWVYIGSSVDRSIEMWDAYEECGNASACTCMRDVGCGDVRSVRVRMWGRIRTCM